MPSGPINEVGEPLHYRDADGVPCTLDTLCRKEPAWAANRIREANREQEAARHTALSMSRDIARQCCTCGSLNTTIRHACVAFRIADAIQAMIGGADECAVLGRHVCGPELCSYCGQPKGSAACDKAHP